jgi:hypothetical protein
MPHNAGARPRTFRGGVLVGTIDIPLPSSCRPSPLDDAPKGLVEMLRFLVRLGILGLAAYGAKTLYDKFSPRFDDLRGPANQFVERTTGAVQDAAERTRRAAREGVGAASDAVDEVGRAADDAMDESARRMQASGDDTRSMTEFPTKPGSTVTR